MKSVAIFDLDGVFVNSNSTEDFIPFFLLRQKRIYRLLLWYIYLFLERNGLWFFKKSFKDVTLRLLIGSNRKDLINWSRVFVEKRLSHLVNEEVFNKYLELKSSYHTILASASLDILTDEFSRIFPFDKVFSSKLAFDKTSWTCLGFLSPDITGRKDQYIHKYCLNKFSLDSSYFFTDNKEDISLARDVGNSFGVVHNADQKRDWGIYNINSFFIRPHSRVHSLIFLVPSLYYFYLYFSYAKSRLIDFLIFYFFFPFSVLLLVSGGSILPSLFLFFISWVGYISLYELGYFMNDFFSIKYETSPSLKIDVLVYRLLPLYIASRIILFLFVWFVLSLSKLDISSYLFFIFLTMLLFLFHNLLPSRFRIFSYPILKLSHFVVPLSLFPSAQFWVFILAFIFFIPKEALSYFKKKNHIEASVFLRIRNGIICVKIFFLCILSLLFFIFNAIPLFLWWGGFILSIPDISYIIKRLTPSF